jgi:hypothetical protein
MDVRAIGYFVITTVPLAIGEGEAITAAIRLMR